VSAADRTPLVVKPGPGTDHVLTYRLKLEQHRFGYAREFRADRQDKRARFLHHAPWPPVGGGTPLAQRRRRVEGAPHRRHALLPGVVVQDVVAEARMAGEVNAEQVLGLPLVPVRGENLRFDRDAREHAVSERRRDQDMDPAGVALAVEHVAQLPLPLALLDDQASERAVPLVEETPAHLGEDRALTSHFIDPGVRVEATTRLAGPGGFDRVLERGAVHRYLESAAAACVSRACSGGGM
jgi:hypothetical protein